MLPAKVIRAPAGLGKTSVVVQRIALSKQTFEIYVPTHKLAEELKALILSHNVNRRVGVIAGRSHKDSSGTPMCQKYLLAEQIAKAKLSVFPTLCEVKQRKQITRCQFYSGCPFIKQFQNLDVAIYTHAHLPLERSRLDLAIPDHVVIDESFFKACMSIESFPLSWLGQVSQHLQGSTVLSDLQTGLLSGKPLAKYIRDNGLDQAILSARWTLRKLGHKYDASNSSSTTSGSLTSIAQVNAVCDFLSAVLCRSVHTPDECLNVTLNAQHEITVYRRLPIIRFLEPPRKGVSQRKQSTILIIDANADREIIGQFFSVSEFIELATKRQARVIQCSSTRGATTSFVPAKNKDPKSKRAAQRRLNDIQQFIDRLAGQGKKVLVVGPQVITGNTKSNIAPLLTCPAGCEFAHFQGIRGIDRWKDFDAVVVIGRNEPPVDAMEGYARAIYSDGTSPLALNSNWATMPRGYRLKSAALMGTDVVIHPDSKIQGLLEQVRECETVQAVDRLRLVHATTQKEVYILSNIPLDIDVDELCTWNEIMYPPRLRAAWETLNGVMPLNGKWLHNRFPHLWKTEAAAKSDVRRARKEEQFPNNNTISNLPLFNYPYRPVSQRPFSSCISRFGARKTKAELLVLCSENVVLGPKKP